MDAEPDNSALLHLHTLVNCVEVNVEHCDEGGNRKSVRKVHDVL